MNGLKDAADDDLILVSDVDEIFSPDSALHDYSSKRIQLSV